MKRCLMRLGLTNLDCLRRRSSHNCPWNLIWGQQTSCFFKVLALLPWTHTTSNSCVTHVCLGAGATPLSCIRSLWSVTLWPTRNPSSPHGRDGPFLMSCLPVFPDRYNLLAHEHETHRRGARDTDVTAETLSGRPTAGNIYMTQDEEE